MNKNNHTKVRHYSQKITNSYAKVDSEAIILELFVAFIAGVFAYIGYRGGILFLLIFCAIVELMALISALLHIAHFISSRYGSGEED